MPTVEFHDFNFLDEAVEFIKKEGFRLARGKGNDFCRKFQGNTQQSARLAQTENDHYIVQIESLAA